MAERIYITLADALHIHADQMATYGGASGVSDEGLIVTALLRPRTGYYDALIAEAAALWESLAMNHGFVDGNKRVAFACMVVFLGANGTGIAASEDEAIRFVYSHLEDSTFRMPVLEAWLRERAIPYAAP
jgi:death on curing protein